MIKKRLKYINNLQLKICAFKNVFHCWFDTLKRLIIVFNSEDLKSYHFRSTCVWGGSKREKADKTNKRGVELGDRQESEDPYYSVFKFFSFWI